MDTRTVDASRAITPVARVLAYGPYGEANQRHGPEAAWGEEAPPTPAYDAHLRGAPPVALAGEAHPPNPLLPAHPERWGAFFWLVTPDARVRVLLGPPRPFTPRALRLAAGDRVEVLGYRVHVHEEDVVIAARVVHGRDHATLLDADRRRPGDA